MQIIRAKWAGGVTKPGGDEVDDLERNQYQLALVAEDGSEVIATPFFLAGRGDGDNNHMLCMDIAGEPTEIFFAAVILMKLRPTPIRAYLCALERIP